MCTTFTAQLLLHSLWLNSRFSTPICHTPLELEWRVVGAKVASRMNRFSAWLVSEMQDLSAIWMCCDCGKHLHMHYDIVNN